MVAHFDRVFDLGLSAQDRARSRRLSNAVGDGAQPYERDGAGATLKEINDFNAVLGAAIPAGDKEIVALAVDTIGSELRELTERYPDRKNTSVSRRRTARTCCSHETPQGARSQLAADRHGGAEGRFADAAADYKNYRNLMAAAVPALLAGAEPMVVVQSRGA